MQKNSPCLLLNGRFHAEKLKSLLQGKKCKSFLIALSASTIKIVIIAIED